MDNRKIIVEVRDGEERDLHVFDYKADAHDWLLHHDEADCIVYIAETIGRGWSKSIAGRLAE